MEELFLSFWNRSISAGWLILAVVALRLVLKKAPKSLACLLWLLVGVRLACPFSIQSTASLLPSVEMIPQTALTQLPPQIHTGINALNSAVNPQIAAYYAENAAVPAVQIRSIALICAGVWLLGMAVMALWALASWLRLRRRVAEAVPDGEGVWLCSGIASPFLLGIFRPKIYLPSGLDGDSRTYVVAHETAHIKRLDHLTKPAGFLLLSVYWFQPLVWLAYVLLCRDIELACDERVIRKLGAACKKPYSEALLQCSARRSGALACPLAFGEVGVKERVKNVLNYKKPAFWVIAVSLVLCAAAAVCFLTDPVEEPVQSKPLRYTMDALPPSADEYYTAYVGGALVYQPLSYSSYFPGWHSAVQISSNDALTITASDGTAAVYTLSASTLYTREEFYSLFADLREQEARSGVTLLPQNTETILCRTYEAAAADGNASPITTWEWEEPAFYPKKTHLWIGYGHRLFELIPNSDSQGTFCYDDCLVWDYDPHVSTLIPVCFDLDVPVTLIVKSGVLFSRADNQLQEMPESFLELAPGETVYWQPFPDGKPAKAQPEDRMWILYSFKKPATEKCELLYKYRIDDSHIAQDTLELRPLMDGCGLYGSKTYGISNRWFDGRATSPEYHAVHYSALEADPETGALLVRRHEGTVPYSVQYPDGCRTGMLTTPPPQIANTAPRPQVTDAAH